MSKKYLIISIICLVLAVIGFSIAYFTTLIVGEEKTIVVDSNELKIEYIDSSEITATNIEPGWNTSKTFSVENKAESTYLYNIVIKDLVNTFKTYGNLQYKIESTNSGYNTNSEWIDVPKVLAATDTVIANKISIPVNVKQEYTIYLRYQESGGNQNIDQGKTFSGKIEIEEGTNPTLLSKLLEINTTRLTRTSFDDVLTTDNTGTLYTTQNTEDGSLVYYFAGNALNNWVKFGKCTSADYNCTVGDDLYWRIIRTNTVLEDGGIRLLYAGSGSVANQNAFIKTQKYNSQIDDEMYLGYMYGTSGSLENNRTNQLNKSNPASTIESWYTATFNNNSDNNTKDTSGNLLTTYISPTAIYCNDRSVGSLVVKNGTSKYYYGTYTRLVTNKAPSYACGSTEEGYGHYFEEESSIADKFTGSQTNKAGTIIGNGLLSTSPAALITADEISFAGGKYDVDAPTWYYYNAAQSPNSIVADYNWWTMSPNYKINSGARETNVVGSAHPGYLNNSLINANGVTIRPVISLKSNVLWKSGTGEPTSPFEVELP